jgi:hypothetical protein
VHPVREAGKLTLGNSAGCAVAVEEQANACARNDAQRKRIRSINVDKVAVEMLIL